MRKNFKNFLEKKKIINNISLIDKKNFDYIHKKDYFKRFSKQALSLNKDGFCLLDIKDPFWEIKVDQVVNDFKKIFDFHLIKERKLRQKRFQDAWLHYNFESVKKIACHPEILEALKNMFGREPFPFQTLNFPVGSEQPYHSDSLHFNSDPIGFMCGVWVALEDISSDSGPLIYYPGSHRLPYMNGEKLNLKLEDVKKTKFPQTLYQQEWRNLLEKNHFKKTYFLPQKGQVLIWHANLLHGGSKVLKKGTSRWSQVTHYFFKNCKYLTPLLKTKDAKNKHYKRKVDNILLF